MAEEFLNYGDWAEIGFRDVLNVGMALSVALSRLPRAGKGPLSVLIDDPLILDNHVDGPQV